MIVSLYKPLRYNPDEQLWTLISLHCHTHTFPTHNHKQTDTRPYTPFQNFLMPCVSYSSYEVGLLSLIGCRFEFGVNRFEKEYLRKCAFWQRLQAGMYGAHVSLESGVRSHGSPLESVPPSRSPPPTSQLHGFPYRGRPRQPDAKENIHATPPCECDPSVGLSTHRRVCSHVHTDKHNIHVATDTSAHTQTWKSPSTPNECLKWGKKEQA